MSKLSSLSLGLLSISSTQWLPLLIFYPSCHYLMKIWCNTIENSIPTSLLIFPRCLTSKAINYTYLSVLIHLSASMYRHLGNLDGPFISPIFLKGGSPTGLSVLASWSWPLGLGHLGKAPWLLARVLENRPLGLEPIAEALSKALWPSPSGLMWWDWWTDGWIDGKISPAFYWTLPWRWPAHNLQNLERNWLGKVTASHIFLSLELDDWSK